MLSAERRSRWLFAGEAEVPQALSSLLARAPSRVVRADAVTDSPQPLPRRGFLVVSDQALRNPRTCEELVRRSLSGVRVIRFENRVIFENIESVLEAIKAEFY